MLQQDFHHFYYYSVGTHSNVSLQLDCDTVWRVILEGRKFPQIELSQLFKGKLLTNRHRLCKVPTEKEAF